MENKIENFILEQLSQMANRIRTNYRKSNHKEIAAQKNNNPFRPFSGKNATITKKYMYLSRSFDSQLGNRLQKICGYIARCKYGNAAVPNYLFIKASSNNKKIELKLFSYPQKFLDIYSAYGFDGCNTTHLKPIDDKTDISKLITNKIINIVKTEYRHKNKIKAIIKPEDKENVATILKYWEKKFRSCIIEYSYDNCSEEQIQNINNIGDNGLPIDLIYFTDKNNVFLYELKSSGALDTKNKIGNANEVIDNEKLFSFLGNVHSFFATYYNYSGEFGEKAITDKGVTFRGNFPQGPMFNSATKENDMDKKIIVGSIFWEKILPKKITYRKLIEIYTNAFKKSGIESIIDDL